MTTGADTAGLANSFIAALTSSLVISGSSATTVSSTGPSPSR